MYVGARAVACFSFPTGVRDSWSLQVLEFMWNLGFRPELGELLKGSLNPTNPEILASFWFGSSSTTSMGKSGGTCKCDASRTFRV